MTHAVFRIADDCHIIVLLKLAQMSFGYTVDSAEPSSLLRSTIGRYQNKR